MNKKIEMLEENLIQEDKIIEPFTEFSDKVLLVQEMLNRIKINKIPLEENGFYNDETKNAIVKLQGITLFEQNGIIDQNLMFRLNEIIENPFITDINKNCTFAVLYSKR